MNFPRILRSLVPLLVFLFACQAKSQTGTIQVNNTSLPVDACHTNTPIITDTPPSSPTTTEIPSTATPKPTKTARIPPTLTASPTLTPTSTAATLAEIVEHLDTPEKLSAFLLQEITFTDHDGCLSYWPDVFYQKRAGNCKDYSTFASYVLAQNSYPARRIVYTFYRNGIQLGHEVAAYELDGQTWIMSNGNISGPFASLNDYFNSLSYLDYVTLLCIKPPGGVTCCNP